MEGNVQQLVNNTLGVLLTWAFAGVATFVIIKLIDITMGVRVDEASGNRRVFEKTLAVPGLRAGTRRVMLDIEELQPATLRGRIVLNGVPATRTDVQLVRVRDAESAADRHLSELPGHQLVIRPAASIAPATPDLPPFSYR